MFIKVINCQISLALAAFRVALSLFASSSGHLRCSTLVMVNQPVI